MTDYELLKQNISGLDVLAAIRAKESVLVTSHYANPAILERAALLCTRILPKLLVAEVAICLKADASSLELEATVDVIIVDDKPQFMEILIDHYLKGKKVKLYPDPYSFLAEYAHYPKTTPICLDDDFGIPEMNGRILAEKLHTQGYERLFLISGRRFDNLPPYLTAIEKNRIGTVLNE